MTDENRRVGQPSAAAKNQKPVEPLNLLPGFLNKKGRVIAGSAFLILFISN
jgi:hypothetical protein